MSVYEVFRQEKEAGFLQHEGSVEAPSAELAVQYAREIYSRRSEARRLWVVPHDAIIEVSDPDFLQPPLERTYRMGEGYRVTVEKRRLLRTKGAEHDA
jgi:ring-1,2-phenylacetyl-CoA epoxidase subunit PaaB